MGGWARFSHFCSKIHHHSFLPLQFSQSNTHPQVALNNSLLPLGKIPHIMGVIFVVNRASPRSLFMYAALIWFPNASSSLFQKLQIIQNSALRIATGCVKMTSIDHLHSETEMLPDQDHLSLISFQYLARALQPYNPSHSIVASSSGIRDEKISLQSQFLNRVSPYLWTVFYPTLIMGLPSNPFILKLFPISILFPTHNRVLQTASPQIAAEEANLPCPCRNLVLLSQLRSSICSSPHSYRDRIGLILNPPLLFLLSGTPFHSFSCSSHSTLLTERHLWERPRLALLFLCGLLSLVPG